MAIKGLVYDVTKGREFYGKKGSYNVFAGKDCTRAVAKWSKDPEDMIPSLVCFNKLYILNKFAILRIFYLFLGWID